MTCAAFPSRDHRRRHYATLHRPQTLQNFRQQQQQQELAVLDEIYLSITVYKAMAALDGDGPIYPPVRRIRRTPARARRRPAPPHVYRQQLYLHPEDMQFDDSYTWTRNSGGPEATVSVTRCHASVAAGIGVTHVGPPCGAISLFGRILLSCNYSQPCRPLGWRAEERRQAGAGGLSSVGSAAVGHWRTWRSAPPRCAGCPRRDLL